jgi:dihydroorotate dehydrogenase
VILTAAALPLLRVLDPEDARWIVLNWLKLGLGPKVPSNEFSNLRTSLCGIELANPLGLAAGFDKDAEIPRQLIELGFAFVECGTVTPMPQPGNPRKRLFRLKEDEAVINRMGFNSVGLEKFSERLFDQKKHGGVIGANIGANKNSRDPIGDYVGGLNKVWGSSSYVAINISSPNTPGLRDLQGQGMLGDLLGRIEEGRQLLTVNQGHRPLLLKVAPDLDDTAIEHIVDMALRYGVNGLIVSNTTTDRPEALKSKYRNEVGGLSGRPLFEKSTRVLRSFAEASRGELTLVGVGGVRDAKTALAKLKAGACAVQLYTAWAYAGPDLPRRLLNDLSSLLKAEGFATVSESIGADLPRRALKHCSAA